MWSGIGHSAFWFYDYDRAIKFYRDILEFEEMYSVKNEQGEMHYAKLRITKNQYMEVFAESYTPHGIDHSHNHMCYIVDDITAVARQLEAKGLKLFRGPSFIGQPISGSYQHDPLPGGNLGYYIVDPEGNEVEFMQFTAVSQEMIYEKELANEIEN